MSKRSTSESESEDSESKKQKTIQKLVFRSFDDANNVIIDQINGMLALVSEHLSELEEASPIVKIDTYHSYDYTVLRREIGLFTIDGQDVYQLELFGSKKPYSIPEVADLLQMARAEKEVLILNALKAAVENKIEFYGRLVQALNDLMLTWSALALYKKVRATDIEIKLPKNVIDTLALKHNNLSNPEEQNLWMEWAESVMSTLAYVLKVVQTRKPVK